MQVCTSIMWHGFGVVANMVNKMTTFMEERGYAPVDDFRGLALENIVSPAQLGQMLRLRELWNTSNLSRYCEKC